MLQLLDRVYDRKVVLHGLLDCYVRGWAQADAAKILKASAPGYYFQDPLVGMFWRGSLPRYFEILRVRFKGAGAIRRRDVAFFLRGPTNAVESSVQFWREAPGLGLTGTAHIEVGPHGVIAETVAYDLNLASDLLWRTRPARSS